jgi:hypothetical protein
MNRFTAEDYDRLHPLVFRDGYPGFKPKVKEIPNSDGKIDTKRYSHVALKYLTPDSDPLLRWALEHAHAEAEAVARAFGCPVGFWPDIRYGALRVLDYAPGNQSHPHTDFDLFTTMFYRDQPDCFKVLDQTEPPARVRKVNPQCHVGRIGEMIGLGVATRHEVIPSETRQRSIVYLAIPDHDAVLPNGETVRDWLNRVMAASRTEFKPYQAGG